ncbi:MAG: hypothetical protein QGH94_02085 [Phycisphaerae bacterium]|nr:hypothetical protein [Phycisphaerae bacterium]MDP7286763.1 hypothetical protein [Phycisphaerae bacterium]
MGEWLGTFNETMGMHNAAMIMTIAGAFFVTFTVCICWGKMVETFGPIGGMLCAAIIVGTFWVMNHKLPGFGINPELLQEAGKEAGKGQNVQFGLIHQAFRLGSPWIDMGWAIGMGLWVTSLIETKRGKRLENIVESSPRLLFAILGGIIGGTIVGLSHYCGAELFGWEAATIHP